MGKADEPTDVEEHRTARKCECRRGGRCDVCEELRYGPLKHNERTPKEDWGITKLAPNRPTGSAEDAFAQVAIRALDAELKRALEEEQTRHQERVRELTERHAIAVRNARGKGGVTG